MKKYCRNIYQHGFVLLCAFLVSCTLGGTRTSSIPSKAITGIAICSAGLSSSTSANINATIESSGGELSAGVRDNIKGEFLNNPKLSGEQALEAFNKYIECIVRQSRTSGSNTTNAPKSGIYQNINGNVNVTH